MSSSENKRFPYNELRPGQMEIAEIVKDAIEKDSIAIINAPTGFGKTAAVIKGIIDSNAEKILWLVRTVNEIDPVIRELKRFNLDYSFLFSAKRTCPLFKNQNDNTISSEDFWENCRMARIKGSCNYYVKSIELNNKDIWDVIEKVDSFSSIEQANAIVNKINSCPFFSLAELSKDTRFIIATYPYYFKDEIFERVLDFVDLGKLVVVVDEAHSLMNAHSILETSITLRDLEQSLNELKEYGYSNSEIEKVVLNIYEIAKELRPKSDIIKKVDKNKFKDSLGYLDIIADVSEEIREKKFLKYFNGSNAIRVYLTHLLSWLLSLKNDNSYLFASADEGVYRLVSTPLDPSAVVSNPLQKVKSAILISGTIPPGDFVNEMLNINKNRIFYDAEIMLGIKGRIGRSMTIVLGDVSTLYKTRGEVMYRRISYYLNQISKLGGVKLFVYPSYELMERISKGFNEQFHNIKENKDTSLESVLKEVSNDSNIIINAVAGGKITEGIEITEGGRSKIKVVAIIGIPYPQRDAYLIAQEEVLSKRLGLTKTKYYLYKVAAYIRIKQALGRAIRSPDDNSVYFLMDYRYLYGEIKKLLRLKYNKVTKSVDEFNEIMPEIINFLNSSS
ncbi:DNA helicase, Rad3 [Caldisphaera lagunensis DSM 15908]|uniref:DNA helicase, Rad3 n=1 Tax=Caldisphaera lagunensis (strain DSM 15908 / JCM 11604 / ANMR 0165 / IC-154) TaxID=1056495 RepID=L0ACL9_CALLD|nr:ATP-dependent DNA helicase [Caldisphaera lagunensis]AFZ71169.1 DNA helicase, Rad3 [Caldisphaera lagunensis DSM 15908]